MYAPPSRARWGVVLVAQCGTALPMAYPPRPLVAVLASVGFGAASGWAFQLSRVLLTLADPPRAGHHSATMAALTTLAGALGAPLLATLLGVPWILLPLTAVCVLVAVLVAPDPRPTLAAAPR